MLRQGHGKRLPLALMALLATACGPVKLGAPTADSTLVVSTHQVSLRTVRTPLDVILVVDRTIAMASHRAELARLMDELGYWLGGFPYYDVHVGVIAADMGGDGDQCPVAEDAGWLRPMPQGDPYVSIACDGTPPPGGLRESLVTLGALPADGCGPNQALAAMQVALDEGAVDRRAMNPGFLRPGSRLSVLFVTADDDVSRAAGGDLLDTRQAIAWLRERRIQVSAAAMTVSPAPRLNDVGQAFCGDVEPLAAMHHDQALRCLVPPVFVDRTAVTLPLHDRDLDSEGMQPDCTVTVRYPDGTSELMAMCDTGTRPCWRVVPGDKPGNLLLHVEGFEGRSFGCESIVAEVQCASAT